MKLATIEAVQQWLKAENDLSEALMTELCFTDFGYAVRIGFDIVINPDGRLLVEPFSVTFNLDAVERVLFVGDLSSTMVEEPKRIDWGISEIACAALTQIPDGARLTAYWESDRRVEIDCARATLTIPDIINRECIEWSP